MIRQHLATFIWLRGRLRRNQGRKAPLADVVRRLLRILVVAAGLIAFTAGLVLGTSALDDTPAMPILFAWDALVAAFLFFWMIGLVTQLQRAELLSVERFLAFPIPPRVVFLVNYLGSGVLAPDAIVFGSGMLGLAIGLVIGRGPGMLWLLPLVAACFLLVTAASHQFQGWLATLMMNKRRRRHIVAMATVLVILVVVPISQIGPLAGRLVASSAGVSTGEMRDLRRELRNRGAALREGRIDEAGFERETAEARHRLDVLNATVAAERQRLLDEIALPAHRWIPLGWLPYGAMTLAQGRIAPALLGTLGLVLLGLASLARSYRTTMRLYLGEVDGAVPTADVGTTTPRGAVVRPPLSPAHSKARLLEWRLPWLSEHATVILLAGFRSLTRAPEARLMLLTPIVMGMVFAGLILGPSGGWVAFGASGSSVFLRPLMMTGLFLMLLLGMNQMAANQFGFDRDGFRVFVLAFASRKDVLLGKNLALMPFALGLGLLALVALQPFVPMRGDHFVGMIAQAVSIYLVYCLVANLFSIYAPMPIKAGSMKPVRTNLTVILANVLGLLAFPLAIGPTLLPLGVEAALDAFGGIRGVPIYLALSIVQVAAVTFVYLRVLEWQGRLLQRREQRILETVTITAE